MNRKSRLLVAFLLSLTFSMTVKAQDKVSSGVSSTDSSGGVQEQSVQMKNISEKSKAKKKKYPGYRDDEELKVQSQIYNPNSGKQQALPADPFEQHDD